jgi:hypothetical protein
VAFDAGIRLAQAYRALWQEAAQLRFRLNFGTPTCERCDGLKAGPGVAATCYQVRQCNYDNVKDGDATPRQRRVLDRLLDPPQKNLTPNKG